MSLPGGFRRCIEIFKLTGDGRECHVLVLRFLFFFTLQIIILNYRIFKTVNTSKKFSSSNSKVEEPSTCKCLVFS